jgi:hypothetical protein
MNLDYLLRQSFSPASLDSGHYRAVHEGKAKSRSRHRARRRSWRQPIRGEESKAHEMNETSLC